MKIIQSHILTTIKGIRHAFFAPGYPHRKNANMSFQNGERETVLSARREACEAIDIRHDHLTHVYQEHGTTIWTIEENHRGAGALTGTNQVGRGDAMVTNVANLPLAILVADCLPLFFACESGNAVGLAHAGWRGTLDEIAVKTVKQMISTYEIRLEDIHCWIGPGISIDRFIVGNDVLDHFQSKFSKWTDCFSADGPRIDLKRLNLHQLVSAGMNPEKIEISPNCTYNNNEYFSYRRDGPGMGHNMAVIQRDSTCGMEKA